VYGEVVDPSIGPLIRGHGLDGVVSLRGPRPHPVMLGLYAEYDVFAFPSREEEPFGLVALEALAGGCAPVVSRDAGVAEWLVHGVHCLKAARDAPSFARVLARILDGEIPLEPIARRGSAAVWRELHIDAIVPRIERLLRDASSDPRSPSGTPAEALRLAWLAESAALSYARDGVPAWDIGLRPALTDRGASV
jgi:glycosyltransferase involved in cell wall biosynthesis